MSDVTLSAEITAKIDRLEKNLDKAVRDVQQAEGKIDNSNRNTSNSFNKLGSAITGAFAVGSIIALGKQMLDITAKFEKYNAVLTNTLGSQQAAASSLDLIRDFAAKTPFAVDELTSSYIKLANQGFLPTRDQLTQLGDLASSTGKSFDQLTEAILDAQQGEFERLKEFGIRAQDNGDKVTFTFKGIQTQVEKTSASIRDYITQLGSAEGVTGSMQAISETLTGQISNLGDSWDSLLVSFGNRTSGVFKGVIDNVNDLINRITAVNENIANAEKVGVKKGFFEDYIDRWASILNGEKYSIDVIGEDVKLRSKQFSEIANKAIGSAKSAEDYRKALSVLSVEYKKESDRLKGSPTLLNSLRLAYENATASVNAQSKAFEQRKAGNGNFGKKGNKKPKEGFDKLQADLTGLGKQLQNSIIAGNLGAADIDSPLSRKIREAKRQLDDFKTTADTLESGQLGGLGQTGPTLDNPLRESLASQNVTASADMDKLIESLPYLQKYNEFVNKIREYNDAATETTITLTESIGNGLVSALEGIATGSQGAFAAFGQYLAGLLVRIAAAIAAAAALAALLNLVFPGFSLTKGVSNFSSLASSLSGLSGLGTLLQGVPALASGAIVDQPTLALIGEGNEKEVVAPLSKFNNMVNARASEQNSGGNVEFKIRADALIGVLKAGEKVKSRRG